MIEELCQEKMKSESIFDSGVIMVHPHIKLNFQCFFQSLSNQNTCQVNVMPSTREGLANNISVKRITSNLPLERILQEVDVIKD